MAAFGGEDEPPVAGPDLVHPNVARMYDYYLGGAQNFEVDRVAAEQAMAAVPTARVFAQANRRFLVRTVGDLAQRGIDQFLDLGSGIPTVGNVHEIAHRYAPGARIAYVDCEPVAVSHARQLLRDDPLVTVTEADIRRPDEVLSASTVADLLDFTRPVAVLAFAILHFVADSQDPAGLVRRYRSACAPGSCLVISHIAQVDISDDQLAAAEAVYEQTPNPITVRSQAQIAELFEGYTLLEPGIVLPDQWRPDTAVDADTAAQANTYAGVGVLDAAAV